MVCVFKAPANYCNEAYTAKHANNCKICLENGLILSVSNRCILRRGFWPPNYLLYSTSSFLLFNGFYGLVSRLNKLKTANIVSKANSKTQT